MLQRNVPGWALFALGTVLGAFIGAGIAAQLFSGDELVVRVEPAVTPTRVVVYVQERFVVLGCTRWRAMHEWGASSNWQVLWKQRISHGYRWQSESVTGRRSLFRTSPLSLVVRKKVVLVPENREIQLTDQGRSTSTGRASRNSSACPAWDLP